MSNPAYEIPTVARLLETHNNGDDGDAINTMMRDLLKQLGSHVADHGGSAKGTITIPITFTVDKKGVDVVISGTSKAPPPTEGQRPLFPDRARRPTDAPRPRPRHDVRGNRPWPPPRRRHVLTLIPDQTLGAIPP